MALHTVEAAYDGQTSTTTKAATGTTFDVSGSTGALRAFLRFSLSAIPAGSVVTNTRLQFQVTAEAIESTDAVEFRAYNANGTTDPEPDAAATCHSRCGSGSVLASFTTEFQSTGAKEIDLGASVDSLVQSCIDNGFISFGLTSLNFAATETVTLAASEHATNAGPTLLVTYTPAVALGGTQPAATGGLGVVSIQTAALGGTQPAATAVLARLALLMRPLGGTMPAATGALGVSGIEQTANLDITLKQGATTIATWTDQEITGSTPTDYELVLTEAQIASIAYPANNLTLEINGDLTGGATVRVYEVTLLLPTGSGMAMIPLTGTQPNDTGALAADVLGPELVAVAGAQPAGSGGVVSLQLLRRAVAGAQPAASGALRLAATRALAGAQPSATGALRLAATRALSGTQPNATGALAALSVRAISLAGTQPAATGLLLKLQSLKKSLAGTQPAADGDVVVATGELLGGTQPAGSGLLAALQSLRRGLGGTQPAATGGAAVTSGEALAGAQPASSGLLAARQTLARNVAGSHPNATGALARQLLIRIPLAGTQPAADGDVAVASGELLGGAQPASSGLLAARQTLARAVAGTQPAAAGALAKLQSLRRALDGSQPTATGLLTRLLLLKKSLGGTQPAGAGALRLAASIALGGTQPAPTGIADVSTSGAVTLSGVQPTATGALRLLASIALGGTQPSSTGDVVSSTGEALAGSQPASSGLLRVLMFKAVAGAQPAATGQLRLVGFIILGGTQPSATGTALRLQAIAIALAGTQPNATGALKSADLAATLPYRVIMLLGLDALVIAVQGFDRDCIKLLGEEVATVERRSREIDPATLAAIDAATFTLGGTL